jgi:hypothetical protein
LNVRPVVPAPSLSAPKKRFRERDRQIERRTETEKERGRDSGSDSNRQKGRERKKDRGRERERERERARERGRATERARERERPYANRPPASPHHTRCSGSPFPRVRTQREHLKLFQGPLPESRPESGLDCLICAMFAGQQFGEIHSEPRMGAAVE